jgi:ribosomal protein S18 acetylase RimI-like enzyme
VSTVTSTAAASLSPAPAAPGKVVRVAGAAGAARAVAVVALAFGADPPTRWLYPDPQQYLLHATDFVRAFAGRAFAAGTADVVADERPEAGADDEGDVAGAALWLPPGEHPDGDAVLALVEASVPAHLRPAAYAVFEQMDAHHPAAPHWYLPMIGVDPGRQGRGYGSALLRHALSRCDRQGLPAYLEATSAGSAALYRRHGFEAVGRIEAGGIPPIVPMLRRPR